MDGRGRALDNVFIERLWRSVKYEDIYLKGYESGADCHKGLTSYFQFYSHERPHQSLDYRTPWEVHTQPPEMTERSTLRNRDQWSEERGPLQTAMAMAATWTRQAELVRAGVLAIGESDVSRHQSVILEAHIREYIRLQSLKGVSVVRVRFTQQRLLRVSTECEFGHLRDLSALKLELWLLEQRAAGMSPATQNGYQEAWVAFGNWCVGTGRMNGNPLERVPKANPRVDRRRQRRSLTEDELRRLLVAARERPLIEASTIRRGPNKGKQLVSLKDSTRDQLLRLGRERALIYKTLVLTGLRRNELASLTIKQLELNGPMAHAILNPADEKNREGNSIPLRSDLATEISDWLRDELHRVQREACACGSQIPAALVPDQKVFTVPKGLRKILDRDLKWAGISKRDDRGRTIDVHAMRHTFGTLLSKRGVAPRTAQAAMRHSTIDLTMNTYTDPRLLDVQEALKVLPQLPLPHAPCEGRCESSDQLAPMLAPTTDSQAQSVSSPDIQGIPKEDVRLSTALDVTTKSGRDWHSLSRTGTESRRIGVTGFEPATSTSRT